jgi:hypothetical protein
MRRLLIVLIVLAVVGAGVAYFLLQDDDSGGDIEDISTDVGTEFDWGTIEEVVLHDDEEDVTSIQVYFVNEELIRNEMLDASRECAEDYLAAGYHSASCYGFASEEAVEASGLDTDTGALDELCWLAFYSATDETSSGQPAAETLSEGCPESAEEASDEPTDGPAEGEDEPAESPEAGEQGQGEESPGGNN